MINVDLRSLKNNEKEELIIAPLGDPLGARTQDPNIKSVVLYLLS